MSRGNAVKIKTSISESSGYHFKSSTDESSYVIASKHGLCHKSDICVPFNSEQTECCKSCDVQLNLSSVMLLKQGTTSLTPSKVYSFPNNDIAIVQVEEKSTTPLKIGTLKDNEGSFTAFGYKSDSMTSSRLLLNTPEITGDECYFNLESIVINELTEKSENLVGMSGSIVFKRDNYDIPIAYSVITTNEESNDILGEQLKNINFDPMHNFFGSIIFPEQSCKISIDTSFKSHFKTISSISINDNLKLSILVPTRKGFPHFNLNSIATELTKEFELILGNNPINNTLLTVSALRVLEQKKELQPVYKLLASRIVESMMNAPHIYSTYIDHTHYHHIHLLNDSEKNSEFLVASYGGKEDLNKQLNSSLQQILYHINHYALDASLISERAFLDVKYTPQECEALYEVLFGNQIDCITNVSIFHCINLQRYATTKTVHIDEQIKSLVQMAIKKIDQSTIDLMQDELSVSLYVLPMNKDDELAELVEELLK